MSHCQWLIDMSHDLFDRVGQSVRIKVFFPGNKKLNKVSLNI